MKGLQYSTGQVQKLGLRQAFQQVIRQEGVRALWKGNGVTMLHRLPYSAVNFWAYEQFTQQWQLSFPSASNHSQDAVLRRLLAGGAAGMCACTLVSLLRCILPPLDTGWWQMVRRLTSFQPSTALFQALQ